MTLFSSRRLYLWPLAVSCAVHASLLMSIRGSQDYATGPVGEWLDIDLIPSPTPTPKDNRVAPTYASRQDPEPEDQVEAEDEKPKALAPTRPDQPAGVRDGNGVARTLKQSYLAELRAFIDMHKSVPPRARFMGLSGRTTVGFHLHKDGTIHNVQVVKPCEHEVLNTAALDLVRNVRSFKPVPEELNIAAIWHVTVSIAYNIN